MLKREGDYFMMYRPECRSCGWMYRDGQGPDAALTSTALAEKMLNLHFRQVHNGVKQPANIVPVPLRTGGDPLPQGARN